MKMPRNSEYRQQTTEASVAEKMPSRMPLSRMIGESSAGTARPECAAALLPRHARADGVIARFAVMYTIRHMAAAMMMPGKTPAMNSVPTDSSAIIA